MTPFMHSFQLTGKRVCKSGYLTHGAHPATDVPDRYYLAIFRVFLAGPSILRIRKTSYMILRQVSLPYRLSIYLSVWRDSLYPFWHNSCPPALNGRRRHSSLIRSFMMISEIIFIAMTSRAYVLKMLWNFHCDAR